MNLIQIPRLGYGGLSHRSRLNANKLAPGKKGVTPVIRNLEEFEDEESQA
jgi:hypothetical protein